MPLNPDLFTSVYKPDVLSCLADLSNDEVFTPPDVANAVLDMLPQEIFRDPNTKFLDPACKSGVFLREIAKRLIVGLADKIPNLQERCDWIFYNQLYGIAITELTSLLSRRSIYCSKYANGPFSITRFGNVDGNILFHKVKHTWINNKCIYCGLSENSELNAISRVGMENHAYEFIHTRNPEEIFNMKFDVIVSNPPYQLNVGGGGKGSGTAIPIYQHFIEQAKKLNPRFLCMIIPARWYSGGRGLNEFRETMLNDERITNLIDFADSKDCFPGVDIAGGVCYFLWDRDINNKNHLCKISNIVNDQNYTEIRPLNEFSTFIRNNMDVDIVKKVLSKKENTLNNVAYPVSLFGLNTNITPKEKGDYRVKYSGGITYCDKSEIRAGFEIIDKYKVYISASSYDHAGQPDKNGQKRIISSIGILKPGEICTSTYFIVKTFDNEKEAYNLIEYLKTTFVRFLMSQIAISQHISRNTFSFVPDKDFRIRRSESDLFKEYGITKEEQSRIKGIIKDMPSTGGDK
jgi:hypothetical protein